MTNPEEPLEAKPKSTAGKFLDSFLYPLRARGLYILLAVGAISLGLQLLQRVIEYLPFGGGLLIGIIKLMLAGSILGYLLHIVTKTADGYETPPDWQDIGNWGDILRPVCMILAAAIVSFGPVIAWTVAFNMGYVHSRSVFWFFVVWGCVYFPMALTAVAMTDSVGSLNPVFIFISIIRTGWVYWGACITLAAAAAGWYVFAHAFPRIPILADTLSVLYSMYLLMVMGRICGMIYRLRREKLNWLCE